MKQIITNATIGLDLGDKTHVAVVFDSKSHIVDKQCFPNTEKAILKALKPYPKACVAMEVGTHSPWISRLLKAHEYEVLVANAFKVSLIHQSKHKSDYRDAKTLGLLARLGHSFLCPITHRSEHAHSHLSIIHARRALVDLRTKLINTMRSTVKSFGKRLPSCSTPAFYTSVSSHIPDLLKPALLPLLETIKQLTETIRIYDALIDYLCRELYPDTSALTQIPGVGPVTALEYILIIEEPGRFKKSRHVGAYLGLTPRLDQSGEINKQLHITKAGNTYLRKLLVHCAHYILGHFGPDCDLRRYGMRIAARGGKNAKRRAVVAVARKLCVLMHALWTTGEVYEPFRNSKSVDMAA
jgi:transposase